MIISHLYINVEIRRDNICVPREAFYNCFNTKVVLTDSIVDQCALHHLLGANSKLPDHAFVMTEFCVQSLGANSDVDRRTTQTSIIRHDESNNTRYNLKSIPSDCLHSETSRLDF